MSSSFSSATGIDRKSLKRPDSFMTAISGTFSKLSSHSTALIVAGAAVVVIGVGITLYTNRMDTQTSAARDALFLAGKSMESEMKALAGISENQAKPTSGKSAKESTPSLDSVAFKKVDVDAKFPETLKKLKAIDQDFSRTRIAVEARLKLGSLYYNHGDFAKALPWYEKAAQTASGFEKAIALASMGYSYENMGKANDALQSYQKALNQGEGSLKGDLLMGIARSYEALHDTAQARSTYDKILADLPNTEYSKSAEIYRSQLQ